jgi:exodeoxyribonuclease VII large subunit
VETLGIRVERTVRRYAERGRERLDALARLLPKRDALLAPQRQRADDLGLRLDRALADRVVRARGQLDRAGGVLRPAMLDRQLQAARGHLERTGRLLDAVNPDGLLKRGYVRVSARPGGEVITSAAAARSAGALTLHFGDGPLDARVERAGTKAYVGDKPDQPNLF